MGDICIKKTYRKGINKLVVEAYKNGITNPYKLAKKFDISYGYVQTILSEAKVRRERPAHNYRHCRKTMQIVKDLKQGQLSQSEIASKYGVARQWVSQLKYKIVEGSQFE